MINQKVIWGSAWRALLFGAVLSAAIVQQSPTPHLFEGQDKLEHVGAFMLLGAAACLGSQGCARLAAAGGVAVFAIVIEACQWAFAVARTPSLTDIGASLFGLALGVAILGAFERSMLRKQAA